MKDKLINNGIVGTNTELFNYLTNDFTKNIEYKIDRKIKLKNHSTWKLIFRL